MVDGCVVPCVWVLNLNRGSPQVLLAPKQAFSASPRAVGSSSSGGEGWAYCWQQNTSFRGCLSKAAALQAGLWLQVPAGALPTPPGHLRPSGIVVRVELTPLPAPCASLICFWSATRLTCALPLSPGAVHQ